MPPALIDSVSVLKKTADAYQPVEKSLFENYRVPLALPVPSFTILPGTGKASGTFFNWLLSAQPHKGLSPRKSTAKSRCPTFQAVSVTHSISNWANARMANNREIHCREEFVNPGKAKPKAFSPAIQTWKPTDEVPKSGYCPRTVLLIKSPISGTHGPIFFRSRCGFVPTIQRAAIITVAGATLARIIHE